MKRKNKKFLALIIGLTLVICGVCVQLGFGPFEGFKETRRRFEIVAEKAKIDTKYNMQFKYEKNSNLKIFRKDRRKRDQVKKSSSSFESEKSQLETEVTLRRQKSQGYYEEQMPIVVHAESETVPDSQDYDADDDSANAHVDDYYNDNYYSETLSQDKKNIYFPYQKGTLEEEDDDRENHQEVGILKNPSDNNNNRYLMKAPLSSSSQHEAGPSSHEDFSSLYSIGNGVNSRPTATTIIADSTSIQAHSSNETRIKRFLEKLKTLWSLYRVFTSAWNFLANHSAKHQQKPQESLDFRSEINPDNNNGEIIMYKDKHEAPKRREFKENNNENNNNNTKTIYDNYIDIYNTSNTAKYDDNHKEFISEKHRRNEDKSLESKDHFIATEGRYIKGDPLKGYYDFVLTEGSYKFWAVFQIGTAILIIYSTFAAIYYTKINPFVADYDYHDYLGGNPGARSYSESVDFDNDDDDGDGNRESGQRKSNFNLRSWLPTVKHSMEFILEAIDKIPANYE